MAIFVWWRASVSAGAAMVRGPSPHCGARPHSRLAYDDLPDATVAHQLIEAAAGAARIADTVRHRGLTVDDVVSEYRPDVGGPGHPRALTPAARHAHLAVIGGYAVKSIIYRHVAKWVR